MTKPESVSLKKYIDTRLTDINMRTEDAYKGMEKRLEGMNEFRDQLKNQAATFINRDTFEGLAKQVQTLRETGAETRGMASQKSVDRLQVISYISIGIAVLSLMSRFF